ncbi:MAG: Gfo/Idh/MocA family oxidoreductase [Bryobacteraceae bacterium]
MSQNRISRRYFFQGSLLAGVVPAAGFGSVLSLKRLGYKSPNEKLNVAAVGAGGKGDSDISACAITENIVAMADPDSRRAARMFARFPKVPKYKDFRQMLDKEGKNIDAVTVSCPDHMHGTAAMWAMERGKHVYCQKPLTRTVWEARQLTEAAKKYRVATQMGNQGYSNEGTRQCAEIVWAGDIGKVTEAHAWTNRPVWPQGPEVIPVEAPVPETLDWGVWLGLAAYRPYSPAYLPHNWRGFPDFGCGAIGDMACHIMGAPNMALRLTAPVSVECIRQEGRGKYTFPKKSVLRYEFPARGTMPPVTVYWHDGGLLPPRPQGIPEDEVLGDRGRNGSLFIGDKGIMTTGEYGGKTRLLPASKMQDYKFPPPLLTRSPGHYRDWIRACKGGERSCSDFSVAGPFTEWMLLGVLALRFEGKLLWDPQKMRITNNAEANRYIKPQFRKGWKFA